MDFRGLLPNDKRDRFRSGNHEIDHFLKKYAADNEARLQIGSTHVLVEGGVVIAYVTLASSAVALPDGCRGKDMPRYPLPALLIARMGVDKPHSGKGLGTRLLVESGAKALELARGVGGCVGLVTDAKIGAIPFYRKFGFIPIEVPREGTQRHFLSLNPALHYAPTVSTD